MTKLKIRPRLSMLLALLMVVTMLPVSALAAETTDEPEICTDANCSHDHEHETFDVYEIQSDVDAIEPSVTNTENSPVEETPITETSEVSKAPDEVFTCSGHIGESSVEWEFDPSSGQLTITGSGYVEPFYSVDEQPWYKVREQIISVRFELSAAIEIFDLCYWFDGCTNISDVAVPVYVSHICPSDFAECDALRHLTYCGVDVLAEIIADYSNQTDIEPVRDNAPNRGNMRFFSSSCGVPHCVCKDLCQCDYRNYRVASESNNYHIMIVYCNTCGKTNGVIVKGSHSYRSNGTCSLCGYYNSDYDTTICYHTSTYRSHLGCNWTEYCSDCNEYISSGTSHSYSYGSWQNYSSAQHRRLKTCSTCEYSSYEYESHTLTVGSWLSISDTQHQRTSACACLYSMTETGTHADTNDDGYCDDCEYFMTRFSVTVPVSLSLVVSKTGEVYSANNAAIINNSTGVVEVTAVEITAANGWKIAPYSTNMANAKVDTKLIGFVLNSAATGSSSTNENLTLSGNWSITTGDSLPLAYDAVVSAMSEPVSEQVLTIVFVLDWAIR